MVLVSLNYSSIHQLLQLHVVEVVADHHFKHSEELSVRDEAVIIDIVDLKSEPQFLLLTRPCREGVETLHELEERYASILVLVQHRYHSLYQWIIRQLCKRDTSLENAETPCPLTLTPSPVLPLVVLVS